MAAKVLSTALMLLATAGAAQVDVRTAFGTGHLFDLGACAAVSIRVGRQCFMDMPARIQGHLSASLAANVTCVTHVARTPCWTGAMKYTVHTDGSDCDATAILLADAAEECLRNKSDARFWGVIGYYCALVVLGAVLSAVFALLKSMLA